MRGELRFIVRLLPAFFFFVRQMYRERVRDRHPSREAGKETDKQPESQREAGRQAGRQLVPPPRPASLTTFPPRDAPFLRWPSSRKKSAAPWRCSWALPSRPAWKATRIAACSSSQMSARLKSSLLPRERSSTPCAR